MATVMAIIAFILSPVVVYYSAQVAAANQIGDLKTDVRVLQTRTDTIEGRLNRFENKLDALLYANGVDPRKFDAK